MIQYRKATLEDLELLVQIRLRDLKMVSNQTIDTETIEHITDFYQKKISQDTCETLLGYDIDKLVATASLYQYQVLPSCENKSGKVAQITNVWVDELYRHQGIATDMLNDFMNRYRNKVGMICLNSSNEAMNLYQKIGFIKKENYFVMYTE